MKSLKLSVLSNQNSDHSSGSERDQVEEEEDVLSVGDLESSVEKGVVSGNVEIPRTELAKVEFVSDSSVVHRRIVTPLTLP